MTKRFFDRFDRSSKRYEEPMVLLTHPKHAAPAPEPEERQRKQAKWLAVGVCSFIALGVVSAVIGETSDSSSSATPTTTSVLDDLNAQIQDRVANASWDSYYRSLAESFDLPRSEMDTATSLARYVCYYAVELGDYEQAAVVVSNLVTEYPSDYTRSIRSGQEVNYGQLSYRQLRDQDADAFVFITTVDYCPAISW